MYRIALTFLVAGVVAAALFRLQTHATADLATLQPAELRPPSLKPSTVWLPDLPQYQYARRQVAKAGTDFRSRLDLSPRRETRRKYYRLSVLERPTPALQEFQSWLLHVEDAQGHAVSGAELTINGGMPQHGHGLPARPRVQAQTAPGDYRIDGLQYSMPGWWEIKVNVAKGRVEDSATFDVFVE